MRLIDATPLEKKLFQMADKELAKNPYERARVCAYRRSFEMVLNAPTITQPPNPPLTLEDLRKMHGEPVFITIGKEPCIELGFWVLVEVCGDTGRVWLTNDLGGRTGYDTNAELDVDEIRAYRRKLGESKTP